MATNGNMPFRIASSRCDLRPRHLRLISTVDSRNRFCIEHEDAVARGEAAALSEVCYDRCPIATD